MDLHNERCTEQNLALRLTSFVALMMSSLSLRENGQGAGLYKENSNVVNRGLPDILSEAYQLSLFRIKYQAM